MKITPEIIPHHKFYEGCWLLPVGKNHWYYFLKKQNRNNVSNVDFLKTVDDPLKELVGFFHSKGIRTTPSCSGHFHRNKHFEKIFSSLEEDEKQIKSTGQDFINIENGKTIFFKNKNYALPFSRNEFVQNISRIQSDGILGIRLENHGNIRKYLLKLKIGKTKIESKNNLVFIRTFGKNEKEIHRIWEKITTEIKNIFQWKE